ncbi:MAG: hypothetical protein ABNH53_12670 [Henriciella sp.]|jgi:hypothetical protein
MLKQASNSFKAIGLVTALAGLAPHASASFIDSDFYCRTYGCVILHDGFTFDVYDNYIFATGGTVAVGQQMVPWTGNPFQGAGGVNPVITGSRTEGFHTVPLQDQSVVLGIDTNGDGIPDRLPTDSNSSGFIDAGDSLDPFNLTVSTDLVAANTSAQRSFYLSSRTDFYLTAESRLLGTADDLNTQSQLGNIGFNYAVTRNGTDDGMSFGGDTRNGNYIRSLGNVNDLKDIFGVPTRIMEFRNTIRRRDSDSLPAQSVRFDYVYGFEGYDLSMGEGHLQYEIEFDVYNR